MQEILKDNNLPQLPFCKQGKNACPPEDCGGIPGHENLVRVLSNPKDKEYQEVLRWLGGHYEPTEFDVDFINEELRLPRMAA